MFDIAWSELALIGTVALVVIGPKDLPTALYTAGKWVRKARLMARDFQGHLDDMVREAELEELRRQAQKAAGFDVKAELAKAVDPDKSLMASLEAPMADAKAALSDLSIDKPEPLPGDTPSVIGASSPAAAAESTAETPASEQPSVDTLVNTGADAGVIAMEPAIQADKAPSTAP